MAARIGEISAWDGTRLRTGVFTPDKPNGPVCVLLQGHSEFIEKYVEVIAELNARGFTVASLDWRGQGGSARLLADPLKGDVRDFVEYDDDLKSFLYQTVRPLTAEPPLVLAHSMGGHIAIRALHNAPGLFSAAVLAAPMLAIKTRGYPEWLARSAARANVLIGAGKDFVWGARARDPLTMEFSQQHCTSDETRFNRTQSILRAHPELRIAGPSWRWVDAAYRSMAETASLGYPGAILCPVLLFGAGKDRIVKVEANRAFARPLPRGRYVEIAESEHEILMERDFIRARFWSQFDAFVKDCAPLQLRQDQRVE